MQEKNAAGTKSENRPAENPCRGSKVQSPDQIRRSHLPDQRPSSNGEIDAGYTSGHPDLFEDDNEGTGGMHPQPGWRTSPCEVGGEELAPLSGRGRRSLLEPCSLPNNSQWLRWLVLRSPPASGRSHARGPDIDARRSVFVFPNTCLTAGWNPDSSPGDRERRNLASCDRASAGARRQPSRKSGPQCLDPSFKASTRRRMSSTRAFTVSIICWKRSSPRMLSKQGCRSSSAYA